jgi:hypothetical protein
MGGMTGTGLVAAGCGDPEGCTPEGFASAAGGETSTAFAAPGTTVAVAVGVAVVTDGKGAAGVGTETAGVVTAAAGVGTETAGVVTAAAGRGTVAVGNGVGGELAAGVGGSTDVAEGDLLVGESVSAAVVVAGCVAGVVLAKDEGSGAVDVGRASEGAVGADRGMELAVGFAGSVFGLDRVGILLSSFGGTTGFAVGGVTAGAVGATGRVPFVARCFKASTCSASSTLS